MYMNKGEDFSSVSSAAIAKIEEKHEHVQDDY